MIDTRIVAVMAAVFGVDESMITEDTSAANLEQWDSLRQMNLVLALEGEFGIRFPDDRIPELISYRLIALALDELSG
jgi:acyl carrier protein